ncbi:MAG: conjugative transposon protein TraK [Paludibacteraceae bacterium]|nr:conjugative transposon protein TraK [Paludibacteraceae bacterium]
MKRLSNIENGYRTMRVVIFTVLITSLSSVLFTYIYAKIFVAKQNEKIYSLKGEIPVMIALGQNVKENREAEAKAEIEEFHRLFFALNPDIDEIHFNLANALKMSDGTVAELYTRLENNGYYKQMCDANIRCQFKSDSIHIDFAHYPYDVYVYGKTCIVRPSGSAVRNLITSCKLRNVTRTEEIPHGFLIEDFQIIDNSNLENKTSIY